MEWKPIETAPRDGTTFLLQIPDKQTPRFYSAWYQPPESSFNGEVTEWDGHCWVLNDDEKGLIVDEEDHGCLWQPIKPPTSDKEIGND